MQKEFWIKKGQESGPIVAISCLIHGNETVGLEVVQRLQSLNLMRGQIKFSIGNPQAYAQNKRFIDEDLNRLFTEDILLNLQQDGAKNNEQQRALILKQWISDADVLIDLHATSNPSPAFVYSSNTPKHKDLALSAGLSHMVSPIKNDLPYDLYSSFDNCMDRQGGIGLTIECGSLMNPQPEQAYQAVLKILAFLQLIEPLNIQSSSSSYHYFITEEIRAQSQNFRFAHAAESFQHFARNEIIAYDGDQAIRAHENMAIIFPKKQIYLNQVAYYKALYEQY